MKAQSSHFGHYGNAGHVFFFLMQRRPSASKVQSGASLIYNVTINKTVAMLHEIQTRVIFVCLPKVSTHAMAFCCLLLIWEEITARSSHITGHYSSFLISISFFFLYAIHKLNMHSFKEQSLLINKAHLTSMCQSGLNFAFFYCAELMR